MDWIMVLFIIVIAGLIVYLVENYVPMSPPFKTVFRVVAVILLIIWLISLIRGII